EGAGVLGRGSPALAAVEDIVVAVLLRRGRDPLGVAAGVRLGEGEGAEDLAAHETRQVLLPLALAPPPRESLADHVVHGEKGPDGRAAAAELLGEDAVGDHVEARAAE